jgi:hypothetical protein
MPILMPTAEEMQRLPRAKRERIRRAVLAIMLEVDEVGASQVRRLQQELTWGENVRAEARQLQAGLTPEPAAVIRQRRKQLIDALSTGPSTTKFDDSNF